MPYLQLEGKADLYEHFLSSAAKANLVDISEDFHFRIQTIEGPPLLLREVRVNGKATNHGELSDAFYALMLSYPPGEFSSVAPLAQPGRQPLSPTLHWHLANRSCINHHRNSKVTFLRLESAALLRALSAEAIPVAQLANLQAVVAPASLVQLIDALGPQLSSAEHQQHQAITEGFLRRLAKELRELLGPPKARDTTAAWHTSLAIERMMAQLSEEISLNQLADALALAPRSVQACFKSQLALSPMRWLKLARLSQLRQLLWDPHLDHLSIQQLMARCGLSDNSLNRACYREVYGISPREQRRQVGAIQREQAAGFQDSLHHHFDTPEAAIQFLESLKELQGLDQNTIRVKISITTLKRQEH